MNDVIKISRGTTKQDELFEYAKIPSYMKSGKYSEKDGDEDEFKISL